MRVLGMFFEMVAEFLSIPPLAGRAPHRVLRSVERQKHVRETVGITGIGTRRRHEILVARHSQRIAHDVRVGHVVARHPMIERNDPQHQGQQKHDDDSGEPGTLEPREKAARRSHRENPTPLSR